MESKRVGASNRGVDFQEVLSALPSGLIIHEPEGRLLYANGAAGKLLRPAGGGELAGRSIYEFVRPIDRGNLAGVVKESIETGGAVYDVDVQLQREAGEPVGVRVNVYPTVCRGAVCVALVLREWEGIAGGVEGTATRMAARRHIGRAEAPSGAEYSTSDAEQAMRLMLVFGSPLMRRTVESCLGGVNVRYKAVKYPESFSAEAVAEFGPEVVIFAMSSCGEGEAESIRGVIAKVAETAVLVVCLSVSGRLEQELVMAGVRGVISRENDFKLLPNAIAAVSEGELWCARGTLQGVIADFRARAGRGADLLSLLTSRELEVLRLIAKGYRNKEIAEELEVSYSTVVSHVYNLFKKLEISSRTEAARLVISEGLEEK
jgi:DNA-binding NarL/FixJ family response regulator